MIIDMHTHIWRGLYENNKKTLLRAAEKYNISRIYVSALGSAVPSEAEVNELNNEAALFSKEHPDLIGGLVYVSPEHKNALDVVRHGIEGYGFEGIKLWVSSYCNAECVYPVIEAAITYNVPVLLHAFKKFTAQYESESTASHVADLAERYPEAKLIMAHLGGDCYDAIPQIRKFKNVFTDISGSIYRAEDLEYAVRELGAERVLFGSDMPGSFLVNYGQIIDASITERERRLILCENSKRLFKGIAK